MAGQVTNPSVPGNPFVDGVRYHVMSLLMARGCAVTTIGPRHRVEATSPGTYYTDTTAHPFGYGMEGWTTQSYVAARPEIMDVLRGIGVRDANHAYPRMGDKVAVVLAVSVNDANPNMSVYPTQTVSNTLHMVNQFLGLPYVTIYVVEELATNRGTKSCPNCGTYSPFLDTMRASQVTRSQQVDAALAPVIAANPARVFRVNTLEASATSTTEPPANMPNGQPYTYVELHPDRGSFTHGSSWPEHQLWANAIVQGMTQNRPGCGVGVTSAWFAPHTRLLPHTVRQAPRNW